jgi:hypothetical protein
MTIEDYILPNTPTVLKNHIIFTTAHHYNRDLKVALKKFKGSQLDEYINWAYKEPVPMSKMRSEGSVTITFTDTQVSKLFGIVESDPELHEVVYQAMTKTLMNRINGG